MPISEAARADLYTGLVEVLGPRRAETLMAQLPRFDPAEVTTRSDVAAVRSDVAVVKADLAQLRAELRADIGDVREGLGAVNQRLDRLFQTLLVGMFGVAAAFIGLIVRIG
ncbi:MAG TPA: hypothetical protein VMP13_07790 [Acidimicrobiia bacterium]|nr:hypothetical protein [Acidimicrobiia bacterium]